jgi:hypothetical protein
MTPRRSQGRQGGKNATAQGHGCEGGTKDPERLRVATARPRRGVGAEG